MDSKLIFGLKIFEREDINYFLQKISLSTLKTPSFRDCGAPGRVNEEGEFTKGHLRQHWINQE